MKDYITVNDNFRPLTVEKLATLAYEATLGLHYFDNDFTFTYLSRGSDYTSFGQSFLQTDLRGFKLVDRARLIDNQLFLTLGMSGSRTTSTAPNRPQQSSQTSTSRQPTFPGGIFPPSRWDFPGSATTTVLP